MEVEVRVGVVTVAAVGMGVVSVEVGMVVAVRVGVAVVVRVGVEGVEIVREMKTVAAVVVKLVTVEEAKARAAKASVMATVARAQCLAAKGVYSSHTWATLVTAAALAVLVAASEAKVDASGQPSSPRLQLL